MRIVLGSVTLCVGIAAGLAAVLLSLSMNSGRNIGSWTGWLVAVWSTFAVAMLILATVAFRDGMSPPRRRWIIAMFALAGGIIGGVLANVTSEVGFVVSDGYASGWVSIFDIYHDMGSDTVEAMTTKADVWSTGIGVAGVAILSSAGALFGFVATCPTCRVLDLFLPSFWVRLLGLAGKHRP
jgi:hypothetical protein